MSANNGDSPDRVKRHLAAILAADIVSYSRLMEQDEVGTLSRLRDLRRNLIEPKIVEYRGRLFKTMGDGFLAEFASVVDAVHCAVDIQKMMGTRNLDLPEVEQLKVRIGVNLGDVFSEGDDVFGDGVNIAARLESIAPPGGIYVSRAAYDPIRERLAFDFEDLGDHRVKNIARPIQVFKVRISGLPDGEFAEGESGGSSATSITIKEENPTGRRRHSPHEQEQIRRPPRPSRMPDRGGDEASGATTPRHGRQRIVAIVFAVLAGALIAAVLIIGGTNRQRSNTAEREAEIYASAKGNLALLRAYVESCTICARREEANAEIAKLETAEQEERAYASARGNLALLRAYVSTCRICARREEANAEIANLETAEQEERAYASARGNLALLRAYVESCTICARREGANAEIANLETAEQEERAYASARGNLALLRAYVSTCRICAHRQDANAEIAELEGGQASRARRSVLCGRLVDYTIDRAATPQAFRAFLGAWMGAAWNSRVCGGLIVESVGADGVAKISYIYGPNGPGGNFPWKIQHPPALIRDGFLRFQDMDGSAFMFQFVGADMLRGHFASSSGSLEATFRRDPTSDP
ncbi:MAG TPA: adenylate/guanylate cyclase domain-containing protein [Stellaceae bacterium]|nr:adenylate/guanylate cyclase domain-containing protein [Stellaceae bacterium]